MITPVLSTVLYAFDPGRITPPPGTPTIDQGDTLIQRGFNTAIILAGVIATAFLIYAGIKYIMAGGDPGKIKEAQAQITYSVVGLVLTLTAYVIAVFIGQIIGADITGSPFNP